MQEKTKARRRKILDRDRKGEAILHVPFHVGEMMFVKDCPVCKQAAKWTSIGRFACLPCRYLFN